MNSVTRVLVFGAVPAALLFGAVTYAQQQSAQSSLSSASRLMATPGYLPPGAAPDSLLLNPPPPAPGSPAEARDVAAAEAALALHGTARWTLATQDALLSPDTATATFSCAAGFRIDAANTPKLNALVMRSASDLGRST